MPDFTTVCEEAARAGGEILLSWQGRFKVREKGPADLVTEADLASQKAIAEVVLGHFPAHEFLGEEEEGDKTLGDDYCWIVDPLDGTTNYVHGAPQFCVSVALAHERRVISGAVWDPIAKDCYAATEGQGVTLNGEPIRVSSVEQLSQGLVAASFPTQIDRQSEEIGRFLDVLTSCQALRRMGSAALNLCWLASGRFDGYWATNTKVWDIAAGTLIVQEAGGVVTALDGGPLDVQSGQFLAASTPEMHTELRAKLGW